MDYNKNKNCLKMSYILICTLDNKLELLKVLPDLNIIIFLNFIRKLIKFILNLKVTYKPII